MIEEFPGDAGECKAQVIRRKEGLYHVFYCFFDDSDLAVDGAAVWHEAEDASIADSLERAADLAQDFIQRRSR